MCRLLRITIVVVAFAGWLAATNDTASALGKGRGGGGRGGGSGHGHRGGAAATPHHKPAGGPPRKFAGGDKHEAKTPKHIAEHGPKHSLDHVAKQDRLEGDHPWAMQRANEQRKLDHRLEVADRLDKIADANGNEHLHETAERMRQKAHEQFDKRMSKIDGKSPSEDGDDSSEEELPDEARSPTALREATRDANVRDTSLDRLVSASNPAGQANALRRQLLDAERKLRDRTDLAERLRAMAEERGNPNLLQAAKRLEERAMNDFQQRMEALRSVQ